LPVSGGAIRSRRDHRSAARPLHRHQTV